MLARFFIDRPIFAWVISIVIVLFGAVAYLILPVAQYPEITPPTVQVTCNFPGANSVVVRDTVAAPIEQQVNGVEGALYMSSVSSNDGSYNLTVTFKLGVDLNIAQVLVQNRVAQALPKLPQEVQATGVTTNKKSPSILMAVNLFSLDNPQTGEPYFDQLRLSNYATIQLKDELARITGVGDVTLLGQQDYSMRIWVDPEKLAARNMTAGDVVSAIREQNVQVPAGQLGQPPVPRGVDFQYTLSSLGRLKVEDEFKDIILKAGADGQITRVRDVGDAKLGAQNMNTVCRLDGKPSTGLAIWQLPGSNALDVGERVKKKMTELRQRFPVGLEYTIGYDTTPFIEESVDEVIKTLRDAIILVALVVLFFLQDWKAVILPLIDVIVSLVGTLAIMWLMGFSLNNLTLFGLVLAIGIVVDDAIVVLENIERWLGMGYAVREATIHAMDEITGPIIAITLVLSAVFLPSALLPGITGQFYRQFALTIAVSMMISAINAMTMTPARAGAIFKDRKHGAEPGHDDGREALPWWGVAGLGGYLTYTLGVMLFGAALGLTVEGHAEPAAHEWRHAALLWLWRVLLFVPGALLGWLCARPVNRVLGMIFRGFNWAFDRVTAFYGRLVAGLLRIAFVVLVVYGGLLVLTYVGFTRVPTGFIPVQDQGYLVIDFQLPDSSSLERTSDVMRTLEKQARDIPGVNHTLGVAGQSFLQNAINSNFGGMYITLTPFHDRRHDRQQGADAIAKELRKRFATIQEARVSVFPAPPVSGLGNTGGFKLMVQDRSGGSDLDKLQGQADTLADRANKSPGLIGVFNSFRANTPQLFVDIDRTQVKSMGLPLSEVNSALQVFLGGYYVNDFNFAGRTWQVNVQAEPQFRVRSESLKTMWVRNSQGEMVPLGATLRLRDDAGPVTVTRYNTYTAATLNGGWTPGTSTGTVIRTMEDLARETLPDTMTVEWTELVYLQTIAGNTAVFAFAGAVLLVFLVLAAQYESWSLPFAIILVVPMCLLCAITGVIIARLDINIFVQVGFVVLVGLACKNAILVVEFARERHDAGKSAAEAAVEASIARLRPIIMTSFAFVLGVFPLVIATGAGAEMRFALGTAVFSGMIGVTAFGLILTPVFYVVVMRLIGQSDATPQAAPLPAPLPPNSDGAAGDLKDAITIKAHDAAR